MSLTLLASGLVFIAGPQPLPRVDPYARAACVAGARYIEKFVGDYSQFVTEYERRGRIAYDFAADKEQELRSAAAWRIADLYDLAQDREATREECWEAREFHMNFLVQNITKPSLSLIAAQRDRRLGR